jgi:hypothetical protein
MPQEHVMCNTLLDQNGEPVEIRVVEALTCPNGHQEVENPQEPVETWKFNIKAYKVHSNGKWWSKCLKCQAAGQENYWFNEDGTWS